MDQSSSPVDVLARFCDAEGHSIQAIEDEIAECLKHVAALRNSVSIKRNSIKECRRAISQLDRSMETEGEEEVAQVAVECCDAQEVVIAECADEEIKRPPSKRDYLK